MAVAAVDLTALTDFRGTARGDAPATFAHDAHATVTCATCHADPPGHGSHGGMVCDECHAAHPGAQAVTPAECDACHHGPDQSEPCRNCHDAAPPAEQRLSQILNLAGASVPRILAFSHGSHEPLECTACHGGDGRVAVERGCRACHDDHHTPTSSCRACHQTPAPGIHAADAHLGCGGAGCHTDARVLSLPPSRPVCLSCHPGQVDHEPGADCAACHVPDPGAARRGS